MATATHISPRGVHVLDHTLQTANEWIHEVMDELSENEPLEALRALRTVLHVLRDRLPTAEAIHFSSQLPLLISAIFMENYVLREKPIKYSRDEFLQEIADRLRRNNTRKPDPLRYLQAVACVVSRRVSPGAMAKVVGCLPEDLRRAWAVADPAVLASAGSDEGDELRRGCGLAGAGDVERSDDMAERGRHA